MQKKRAFGSITGLVALVGFYQGCGQQGSLDGQGADIQSTAAIAVDQLNLTGDVHKVDCLANNFSSPSYTFRSGSLRGHSYTYQNSSQVNFNSVNWPSRVAGDWTALSGKLPYSANDVSVVVVDVKNVDGIPHYAYFSNGTQEKRDQNWSSTKVLAELAAIHKVRLASNFTIGAGATVDGVPWSSLVKDLHAHSSNSVGEIFKLLAGYGASDGELNAQTFVRGWLARPATEVFNSGYGAGRLDTRFTLTQNGNSVSIPVNRANRTRNLLTPLTMAEFWKRVGVNRRDDRLMPKGNSLSSTYMKQPSSSVNSFAPDDIQTQRSTITLNDLYVMMYGSVNTRANNATHTNGMIWDGGVRGRFNGSRMSRARIQALSGPGGRFIAKTGSSIPNHSAFGGHVCLPGKDGREGREFAFFILGHGHNGVSSETVVRRTFDALVNGFAPEY